MEFSLHLTSLIILFGISTGLILSSLLWLAPWGNHRANRILGLHLANYLILAIAYVYYIEQPQSSVDMHGIFSLQLLIGPLLYFYVRTLTQSNVHWHWRYLWHFLPAPLMALLWELQLPLSPDGLLNLPCISNADCDLLYRSRALHRVATYVSLIGYTIASLFIMRQHRQRIKDSYSAIEEVNLRWLSALIFCQLLTLALAVALEGRRLFIQDNWSPGILMAFSPLIVTLLMGWFGLQQRHIQLDDASNFSMPDPGTTAVADAGVVVEPTQIPANQRPSTSDTRPLVDKKYQTSSLSRVKAESIWQLLQQTMTEYQPYLEPGLKIADLAQTMKVPSHHLSEVINGFAQQSFYDFINQFRVDEAARLLTDENHQHQSVTDIGLQAGFNSNSTYFAHFKKRLQQTPRQYRQQYLHQPPA